MPSLLPANPPQYPYQIALETARELLYGLLPPQPRVVRLPLLQAHGQVLAQDIHARVDHPSLADSALDGIACQVADTVLASPEHPVRLQLVGEVQAGDVWPHHLQAGQAVRIYTGAPVPAGADGIARVEVLQFGQHSDGEWVDVLQAASAKDIRPQGQDFKNGDLGLAQGQYLHAAQLAFAASLGHSQLRCYRPKVAVVCTGNELYSPDQALPAGGVYDSNRYGLYGSLQAWGCEVLMVPIVRDSVDELEQALLALPEVDLIVSSGGVSMGRYDIVRSWLETRGHIAFWKVNMRPGSPVLAGIWQGIPVLGLPGNPVSALVVLEVVLKPVLARWFNSPYFLPQYRWATSRCAFKALPQKTAFWRVHLQEDASGCWLDTFGNQSSGVLRSLAQVNALICVEADTPVAIGDRVKVWMLPH